MQEAILSHLGTLGDAVLATALPDNDKTAAASCIKQLPSLYDRLSQTAESRYDDEITRLYQFILKNLAGAACPEAQKLAAGMPEKLRILHAGLGLPLLALKLPARVPLARKARKTNEKT